MMEKQMPDIFRPRHDPARSIYDAFQCEADKRKGRTVEEWMTAEREAVFREATHQAQKLGLRPPTIAEIISAENYASGSADYGAKWAYGVAEAMRRQ